MRAIRTLLTTVVPHLLFWSWNLLFGTIVGVWLPELAWELLTEAWRGALPWDLAAVAVALLVSPLLAIAAWVPVRKDPAKVFRLLFGVEGPLLLAGLVRLTLLREVTPSVLYLLLVVGLAGFALVLDLYRRRTAPLSLPELAGHAVLVVTAGWVGAVLSFYIPPTVSGLVEVGGHVLEGFFTFGWVDLDTFKWLPFALAWIGFVLLTMALFAVLPIAFFAIYLGTFRRLFRETRERTGLVPALLASVAGVGLTLAPFVALDRHPQLAAFARLEAAPADDAARAALLADADLLREGLLDAYLAKYRYWTSTGESDHIRWLYRDLSPEAAQDLYNQLTRPFVYQGESLNADRTRAADLYARFFDEPIQKGEQEAVLRALNATWDRSTVEAGLLDVNGEKVRLARQQLTVTTAGGLASVQLDEVYRNETYDRQEIFYYFSLPESAVVTGLWLSDDPSQPTKFPGVLAPRGAAQQVYLEQRVERRDPALLEQVGPRQYRLRAFPILPRERDEDEGAPLAVRMTYTTFLTAEGVPLPRLTERRNVYWDTRTERVGAELAAVGDAWLPASVTTPAEAPRAHAAEVGDGFVVTATPSTTQAQLPAGRRYAVVLDRSWSMRDHAAEVKASLDWLREDVAPGNDLDLYVTAGWAAGEPVRLEELPADATFQWFGSTEPHQMLAQYDALRGGRTYDAVLLLTDAGSYDLAVTNPPPTPDTAGALWMVHLGGMAPAYDDALLQALQGSHGGAAASVGEVFARLAAPAADGCSDVLDGYLWCVTTAGAAPVPAEPAFAALAARAFVLHQARTSDMADVANLDAAHRAARAAGVVTPYSSLLALVDDAQRQRLAELEGRDDRFTREAESGVEDLTAPSDPFSVTAVPEPEEWALLLVACGIVLASRARRWDRRPARG